jgi:hypothetical protein
MKVREGLVFNGLKAAAFGEALAVAWLLGGT